MGIETVKSNLCNAFGCRERADWLAVCVEKYVIPFSLLFPKQDEDVKETPERKFWQSTTGWLPHIQSSFPRPWGLSLKWVFLLLISKFFLLAVFIVGVA